MTLNYIGCMYFFLYKKLFHFYTFTQSFNHERHFFLCGINKRRRIKNKKQLYKRFRKPNSKAFKILSKIYRYLCRLLIILYVLYGYFLFIAGSVTFYEIFVRILFSIDLKTFSLLFILFYLKTKTFYIKHLQEKRVQ